MESIAPAPAVFQAPTPVLESIAPALSVVQAPSPVVMSIAPAPAVILAPLEEYISPVPVVDAVTAPVMEFVAPSARTQFLSHQRLQTQRHTSRLSTAPRVERASRLRLVRRDSVLWTRPGTCLTCKWSGSCVLLRRAWGSSGDARRGERNSWRRHCCTSVMGIR